MASVPDESLVEMRVRDEDQPSSSRFQRVVSFEETDLPSLRTTAGVSPERVVEDSGGDAAAVVISSHELSLRKLEIQALVAENQVADGCTIAIDLGQQLAAADRLKEAIDLLGTAHCMQVRRTMFAVQPPLTAASFDCGLLLHMNAAAWIPQPPAPLIILKPTATRFTFLYRLRSLAKNIPIRQELW